MPVSDKARKAVIEASGGWCELFHEAPVDGTMIVHYQHQGMGGSEEDSEYNDPNVLLWGCRECHDLVDGRLQHAPWKIVRFDRAAGELEIVDMEMRKVDHSRIFFHNRAVWMEAAKRYPQVVDAVRRMNEAAFDLARELAFFEPGKKKPELFRVCPEVRQMDKSDFWTFISLLGMTRSKAKELIPVGKWASENEMEGLMRGVDPDALDALRKTPDEELPDMLELARAKPAEFWDKVDRQTKARHGNRAHYCQVTPDGYVKDIGLHATDPELDEAFGLIKGVIRRSNSRVVA
ncbi:MAG: hypothetical protein WC565_05875 [Parcubacteria group bacterium]|jgi:hypothetical protein